MPEKTLGDISPETRDLYQRGIAAIQKENFDYAVTLLMQVLVNEPGFYDARQALRQTQAKKNSGGGGLFKKMFGTASASPQLARGQIALRNNPTEALNLAEQVLNSDPANVSAHKLLAEAALAADFPRTAVLSLEIAFRMTPGDKAIGMRLADALLLAKQNQRAEAVMRELEKANPYDPEISQKFKDVTAHRTMGEGGYETIEGGEGSYRNILKNKDEAVMLEQENREVKDEDLATRVIQEKEARLVNEPNNLKLYRDIAELYTQKKQFDKAIEYYNRILSFEGVSDPSLDRALADVEVKKLDHARSQLNPSAADYAEQLQKLEEERSAFRLQAAKRRVDRYPSDLDAHFELGQRYFEANKISEAIQAFQKSKANPHLSIRSQFYLGQCFAKRNMLDLASRTLQNAINDKVGFDDEKKELIYALGSVLEKMGKREEAIEQFKQIYEVDIGFKDVAAKADDYYAAQG